MKNGGTVLNNQDTVRGKQRDEKLENFAKRNKSKKKILKYIYIPAVLIALTAFVIVCFVFFFKVKTIEVEGAKKYNAESIIIKSGIQVGENLYSFRDSEIEEKLMFTYPYIKEVKIKRSWPDKIIICVKEENAKYVTEAYGETLILSESLRVLENPEASFENFDLCYLILPDIERALVGSMPVFTQNTDYIMKVLNAMDKSGLANDISAVDLKNKFAVSFLIGNTYKVGLGDTGELSLKLNMTDKILKSGNIPTGQKAELNVSNPAECTAIIGENAVISLD